MTKSANSGPRAGGGSGRPLARDNGGVSEASHRRPHVLTLTDVIGYGGAENIAEELAVHADPSRFRRSLCVTRPVGHVPGSDVSLRRLRDAGVEVLLLNRRGKFDLRSLRRLVQPLRSQHVDLIHAHKFGSNVWGAFLGRSLGVPVVIAHEHTWSFEGQLPRRLVDRHLVARFSDAVIAVSDADRERMVAKVKMPPEKVVVVPNGISFHSGDGDAIRQELQIGPDAPVLVQTAGLRPQKAVEVMLRAMAILLTTHPDARLLVAGGGDQSALRATATELGLGEGVCFLGARGDVPDILAAADVGVLSSDFEGMPLAVLEYMAAGLPVVATEVGGVPEIVRSGETGLLVAPRDPVALAAGLRRLLDDRALARAMGERGRSRQHERFSDQAMVRRVTDLYVRLLGERGITVPPPATAQSLAAVE